jgi:hypothetical protein
VLDSASKNWSQDAFRIFNDSIGNVEKTGCAVRPTVNHCEVKLIVYLELTRIRVCSKGDKTGRQREVGWIRRYSTFGGWTQLFCCRDPFKHVV